MSGHVSRREFVKEAALLSAGAAMMTGAAEPNAASPAPPAPATDMPRGKIGELELSRFMLGGNLISGYSHSRDLGYVGDLMRRYNTEAKIIETLEIAEANGIDSINVAVWDDFTPLAKHQQNGGKMKWVMSTNPNTPGQFDHAKKAIDAGADIVYMQGGCADRLVREGKSEVIAKEVEFIKSQGVTAGVGAHSLDTLLECEKLKVPVDFYQKTLHTLDYPSSPKPGETSDVGSWDNSWCKDPQAVIEFMAKIEKPWVAFKVMAAGAIHPRKAFKHALDNGADFVLAGMFDFQIAEDTAIFKEMFAKVNRTRPWRG